MIHAVRPPGLHSVEILDPAPLGRVGGSVARAPVTRGEAQATDPRVPWRRVSARAPSGGRASHG